MTRGAAGVGNRNNNGAPYFGSGMYSNVNIGGPRSGLLGLLNRSGNRDEGSSKIINDVALTKAEKEAAAAISGGGRGLPEIGNGGSGKIGNNFFTGRFLKPIMNVVNVAKFAIRGRQIPGGEEIPVGQNYIVRAIGPRAVCSGSIDGLQGECSVSGAGNGDLSAVGIFQILPNGDEKPIRNTVPGPGKRATCSLNLANLAGPCRYRKLDSAVLMVQSAKMWNAMNVSC